MHFHQIHDPGLSQYAYLVGCDETGRAILFDPQRDIDRYLSLAERLGLEIVAVAETHIHADFLSGVQEFARRTDILILLSGAGGKADAYVWPGKDGNVQFLEDGDTVEVGRLTVEARHTPGHTPEHLSFLIAEPGAPAPHGAVTGDFLFVGDLGRPDLLDLGEDSKRVAVAAARQLYRSARDFAGLPDGLLVWPGHGAGSACGKSLGRMPHSSLGYEKATSPALHCSSEQAFIDHILADQPDPPLYFARMKHLNREGTPPLAAAARPRRMSAVELLQTVEIAGAPSGGAMQIVDTRTDRKAALRAHLPGSLYAPLDAMFATAVGVLHDDPSRRIILVIEEARAEEAWRRLVRVGIDGVDSYVEPASLGRYFSNGGEVASIGTVDFEAVAHRPAASVVLDVRTGAEYRRAHIPGAVNIAYQRLPENLDRVPRGEQLFVHCGSGARASAAASYLAGLGFPVVVVDDLFANYARDHETRKGMAA